MSEVGLVSLKMENKGFSFERFGLSSKPLIRQFLPCFNFKRGIEMLISACRTCGTTIFVQPIILLICRMKYFDWLNEEI